MSSKAPTGIRFFDERFGGAYEHRMMLVTGRAHSGKTICGLQFIQEGLSRAERGLILSATPSSDLALLARGVGIDVDLALESGALILLEYFDFIPGRDSESSIMLPPECFAQLQDVVERNGIDRMVIDTVVPWITFSGRAHQAEHIFSFVRAFERMGTTAVFTCPKPKSAAAQRAHKYLVHNVPVAVTLDYDPDTGRRGWTTNKYLGRADIRESFPLIITAEEGLTRPNPGTPDPGQAVPSTAETPSSLNQGIRFSDLDMEAKLQRPSRQPARGAVPPPNRPKTGGGSFARVVLDD